MEWCVPRDTVRSRVHVVWVMRRKRLSANVVREVCAYYVSFLAVARVVDSAVEVFNTAKGRWEPHFQVQGLKPCGLESMVFVGKRELFLCGGLRATIALLLSPGDRKELPDMRRGREGHAAVFDPRLGRVLALGGIDNTQRLAGLRQTHCETFDNQRGEWSDLPAMCAPRAFFTPCRHDCSLYICGGQHTSIEVFNFSSSQFNLLSTDPIFEESPTLAVVAGGEIVILTLTSIEFRSLIDLAVRGRKNKRFSSVWSKCPTALVGDTAYISDSYDLCRGFDLSNGAVVTEE